MILYFFVLSCSFSFFIYDFIDLSAFPFFVMWLAKGLSILFFISKSQVLVSLIFSIAFFCSQAPLAFRAKCPQGLLVLLPEPQLWSLTRDMNSHSCVRTSAI